MACDGAEVVEGVAEVDDYEVGGKTVGNTFAYMQQGLADMTEGVVVSHVGEHYIRSLSQIGLCGLCQCSLEGFETGAFLCRERKCAVGGSEVLFQKVYFVVDYEKVLVFEGTDVLQLLKVVEGLVEGLCCIVYIEDDVGLYYGFDGALNAEGFNGVVAVAQSCGVDDAEGCPFNDKGLFDGVACGAGNVADDGTIVMQECVEEGGFSCVRTTDNGYRYAPLEGVAHVERFPQFFDAEVGLRNERMQAAAVGKLYVLVAEVEFEFKECCEVNELLAELFELFGISTSELAYGEFV